MAKTKDGCARLLVAEDLESGKKNAFNNPLIGWKSASLGEGALINPRGFAMLRIVVQKITNGKPADLYDQPILIENTGSIAVCLAGGKVGLVESFRMVGERILEVSADYVRKLNQGYRWGDLIASLGAWRWELPRGIPPATGTPVADIVVQAAKIEALEESGFQLVNAREVGRVNTNPTFFAHAQHVVTADIKATGDNKPEELEIIGKTKLFSPAEIRELVSASELDDGLTLSALAIAGFHF